MRDPYEVLEISPNATDDEVKAAYRRLARKYHPDNYTDNPLSDLAQEKMQEINEAYDTIIRLRQGGANANGSQYADIRGMIQNRRYAQAEELLDGIPASARGAEWYFLKGQVLYQKGWLEDANRHFYQAAQMDPQNAEYRAAANQSAARRGGSYAGGGTQTAGCSGCDMCTGLLCADCCCECMGGDLIRCC
ncbi:MAG: J domain-containing protein [Acutalibacteraceae bacterium]